MKNVKRDLDNETVLHLLGTNKIETNEKGKTILLISCLIYL